MNPKGALIIIGGHENKEGHRPILEEVARRAGNGKVVVATLASEEPQEQWKTYRKVFRDLGVKRVEHLDARRRAELVESPRVDILDDATVMFFAGGDQTKITSRFGGTALCTRMREMYREGLTVAGTSSGASVMSDVMLTGGDENESGGGAPSIAPGLELIRGIVIDQHFAQRGRISRLFKAIAINPRLLGVGIDEDTAMVLEQERCFQVLGSGAVYVVDGQEITFSLVDEAAQNASSMYGFRVHVLSAPDEFDLITRTPLHREAPDLQPSAASQETKGG